MTHPWLAQYPAGVPAEIDTSACRSLVALMAESFERYAPLPAYRFLGRDIGYRAVDQQSRALAAWLQAQGLQRGDRVAVMMPNVPQVPVAVAAILRAGLVVVNVNPLATARELEHQLRDAGAKGIVILEDFASALQQVLPQVPVRSIVVATMGDMVGPIRGMLVNHVARHVRKTVPPFELPQAVGFSEAVARGRSLALTEHHPGPDDIAVLQYTSGTTGASKGAVLLHRNLVANVLQCEAWFRPALRRIPAGEQIVFVCAVPLHHVFGFNIGMMLGMRMGSCSILIPNARDIPGLLKTLEGQKFHGFPGLGPLFQALLNHADFDRVDWSALVIAIGGGMAVQPATARAWLQRTGCPICECYGLSETSPIASCNRLDAPGISGSGSIGYPLPGTVMKIIDDTGRELPPRHPGEIAIRGPQVMAGYWLRPEQTSRAMTSDGFLRSGDIGAMDDDGRMRIVDRKRDMIIVSGLNVSPNEIEDAIASMPGVLEVGAVGTPDPRSGEAIKVVVVRKDPSITEAHVHAYAQARLTGYKRPQIVEFRNELPKTPVGKILRRELRN